MTIPSLHQDEIDILEPATSSVQKRLETLTKFSDRGIYTYIFLGPLYPTIDTENLPRLLETYLSTGIKELVVDTLHLKPGIWPEIKKILPNKTKDIFKTHLFSKEYYPAILKEIQMICQKNDVLYRKAFTH
jgi:DNA repair photolyase